MCKRTCCPPASSGLGPVVAIASGLVLVAVVAGPVAAAAASLLHALVLIATITAAALASLVVAAITVILIRRTRTAPGNYAPITIPARTQRAHPVPAARPLPRLVPAFRLTQAEQARCVALGIHPDHAAQIIAAILDGQHQPIARQGSER